MPTILETATVPRTVTPTLLKILDIACEINKYQPSFISSIAILSWASLSLFLTVILLSSKLSKSTVIARGIPISSALAYLLPIVPLTSYSTLNPDSLNLSVISIAI